MQVINLHAQIGKQPFDFTFRIFKVVGMTFFGAFRTVRAAILMVDQNCFADLMQAARDFYLSYDKIQILDGAGDRDAVIVHEPEAIRQPIVEIMLKAKVNTMDDHHLTGVFRHAFLFYNTCPSLRFKN
jgi:phenolic acid decarboxylase